MLYLMSEKQFKKNAKKLVEPKDYIICDATDDENGSLTKYSNVVSMHNMNPTPKLVKVKLQKDFDSIDEYKVEKMEKKFFKSKGFITSSMACVKGLLDQDCSINMFIVMRNKAYKVYGKKFAKRIKKLFDVEFDFIFTFEDYLDNKKIIKKDLQPKFAKQLTKSLSRLEKKYK